MLTELGELLVGELALRVRGAQVLVVEVHLNRPVVVRHVPDLNLLPAPALQLGRHEVQPVVADSPAMHRLVGASEQQVTQQLGVDAVQWGRVLCPRLQRDQTRPAWISADNAALTASNSEPKLSG